MANVGAGVGPVFIAQRGDFGLTTHLLKIKNSQGRPRFVYTMAGHHIMDAGSWPNSNRFWLYNHECKDYQQLIRRVKSHSELEDWEVADLGEKPMDFVASDRAIYDHVVRQESAGRFEFADLNPAHFFKSERNVRCMESWVSAMKEKYDGEEEW